MEDRKQRGIPKLRDLLRRQRRESEGQIDMTPDVDFVYRDADQIEAEIAELYSYTEEEEFKLNKQAFEDECLRQGVEGKWSAMDENKRRMVISQILDKIETVHSESRLAAARVLLYLVQGNFGDINGEEEQRQWSKRNVILLYEMGAFPFLVQLLNVEIDLSSHAALSALHKPSVSMADSIDLRVYINIIYTIVETMRVIDPDDSEETLALKEDFRVELGQPIIGEDLLCVVLMEMVLKFCAGGSPHFPIKKVLLLLWKTILLSLGGEEHLAEQKKLKRIAAGLPASFEDQWPSPAPIVSNASPSQVPPSTPPPSPPPERESDNTNKPDDEGRQILGAVLKLTRPQRLRPKVRQKDVDTFLDNSRSKFVGFQLRSDQTTLAGLPGPIREGLAVLKRHLYQSLSEIQLKEEEEAFDRPFSKAKDSPPSNPTEELYQAMLPNLPQYMIALLKILLAAAPTAKAKAESINILSDVLPEEMPSTVLHSMRLGIDVNRHKEIIVKAISGILFLLLKHFKINHVYQFECMSQHLVFANCIPLILKFLNQNISAFITAKNTIPQLDFPACIMGDTLELTAESLENVDSEACCWRNMFSCINLLRILEKLTKWKHSRTMMLVVFKSAPILKRALKVRHDMLQLYVLKLLKAQTKYLGRNWRKSNMKTMSAIYQKVRHRLNDDWAYGNDLDARPWDFQAEECSLRACVERFNNRRYGLENGEQDEDELQPVDNNLQSLLGQKMELCDDFKKNYEKWLDREVFSTPVNWDQLCTCERG